MYIIAHDHQRAIYCHFNEHLNHAKVYHVIQVIINFTDIYTNFLSFALHGI